MRYYIYTFPKIRVQIHGKFSHSIKNINFFFSRIPNSNEIQRKYRSFQCTPQIKKKSQRIHPTLRTDVIADPLGAIDGNPVQMPGNFGRRITSRETSQTDVTVHLLLYGISRQLERRQTSELFGRHIFPTTTLKLHRTDAALWYRVQSRHVCHEES